MGRAALSPGRLVASTDILRVFALIALIFIEYIQDHKIANLDFIPVFIERTIFCVVKYFAILNIELSKSRSHFLKKISML